MLAVGAGGGCLDMFSLIYHFSFLSPSLWETARHRLKYCLKGPLSPKQPINLVVSTDNGQVKDTVVTQFWAFTFATFYIWSGGLQRLSP